MLESSSYYSSRGIIAMQSINKATSPWHSLISPRRTPYRYRHSLHKKWSHFPWIWKDLDSCTGCRSPLHESALSAACRGCSFLQIAPSPSHRQFLVCTNSCNPKSRRNASRSRRRIDCKLRQPRPLVRRTWYPQVKSSWSICRNNHSSSSWLLSVSRDQQQRSDL